ncbi:MAG TPA: diffusible signal factor-reguated Ax21 family protein [Stenotrophomonas sp.]|nr:diffusible signal factor-reguated Ax21 family protein [Stenotrophomonas sp.]
MKISLPLMALLISVPFSAAAADNLSYNYVEADYVTGKVVNTKADGWGLKASYAFHPNFHVFGGYQKLKLKTPTKGSDSQWNIGVGYNYEIGANTDLLTRVSYQQLKQTGYPKPFKGWTVEAGVNHAFSPNFSAFFLAGYEDFGKTEVGKMERLTPSGHIVPVLNRKGVQMPFKVDPKGKFFGRVGAQYNINENFAINAEVKKYVKGGVQWSIGPRITW